MIHGLDTKGITETEWTLQVMENVRSIEFYLTGSRFFRRPAEIGPETDYDFFTQYKIETIKFLAEIGFVYHSDPLIMQAYAQDPNVATVLRHERCPIDIQLVVDLEMKIACQHLLDKIGCLGFVDDKQIHKLFWHNTFKMLKLTQKTGE